MPDLPWFFLGALALAILASTVLCIAAVRVGRKADDDDADQPLGGDWRLGP